MAWTQLKNAINDTIKANNNQEITGSVLNSILNSIVNNIGKYATFAGIATPSTNPGVFEGPVVFFANTAGIYPNFGNIVVNDNQIIALYNIDGSSWESYEIANNTITTNRIANGAINTKKLQDKCVTSEKIADGAINELVSEEFNKINTDISNLRIDLSNISSAQSYVTQIQENMFAICDDQGSIAFCVTANGIDAAVLTEHFINILKAIDGLGDKTITETYYVDDGYTQNIYWRFDNGIGSSPYLRINYYNSSGHNHKCSKRIPVREGDILKISYYGSGTSAGWALCDENNAIYSMDDTKTKGDINITAEKDGFLYVNDMYGAGGKYAKVIYKSPEAAQLTRRNGNNIISIKNKKNEPRIHNRPFPYGKRDAKILFIGNSFTADSTAYLPEMIEAAGLVLSEACLYYTFVSGATFKKYCELLETGGGYTLTNVFGNYSGLKTGTLDVLLTNDWDVVFLQQGSEHSKDYNLWQPYLDKLIKAIKKLCPSNPCIAYHQTWNPWWFDNDIYTENGIYIDVGFEQITDAVRKIQALGIDYIIPTGTAIQNIRHSSLNTRHNLHRDDKHLAFGLARYTAACCVYATLIADLFNTRLYDNPYIHTVTEQEIADTGQESCLVDNVDVTDENKLIIQECVINAVENIHEVTLL